MVDRKPAVSPSLRTTRLAPLAALAALGACSPVSLLNRVDRLIAPGTAQLAVEGVAFGRDPRQKLDVWAPRARNGLLPVVVFFYGGGWNSGDRADYGFAGAAFAGEGFIAVIPDYRLVPGVRFPDFVEDGALAVRWARDNAARFGGDPGRITLAGHSAGAYNAAMLALDRRFLERQGVDPKIVRAAALLAGPYDFYPFTEMRGRNAFGAFSDPQATQPIRFARADAPPLLLAHGGGDKVVLPRNSRALARRLMQLGAPVTLRIYPGASHVDLVISFSRPFRKRTPALAESAAFLRANSL